MNCKAWATPTILGLLSLGGLAQPAPCNFLLRDTFPGGQLTSNIWDARLRSETDRPLVSFNHYGSGEIAFWGAPASNAPSIFSLQTFDRKPGRCLAIAHRGNVSRGGVAANPALIFSTGLRPEHIETTGPGWFPGQFQGRFVNTAVPLVDTRNNPERAYAHCNDNVNTLFLTVLRKAGAFYLMSGEPAATPPRAKLGYVSHTGAGGPYHAAVTGGPANFKLMGVAVADLGGAWAEEYGLASLLDRFQRSLPGQPERGGTPWAIQSGAWTVGNGKLSAAGRDEALLLTDTRAPDGQWEVTATPGSNCTMVGLIVRGQDEKNFLRFEMTSAGTRLLKRIQGVETEVAPASWREIKLQAGVPHRLAVRGEGALVDLYVDDQCAQYGLALPASFINEFVPGGSRVGLTAKGSATFENLAGWPLYVNLPPEVAALLPEIAPRANGPAIVFDNFDGPDGSPLGGRKPKIGANVWAVQSGAWTLDKGGAALAAAPGCIKIDCGANDYEVSATIRLPDGPAQWPNDWFPAIVARGLGAGSFEKEGVINARFLWQGASNEIEVWDRPPDDPRAQTELINASNITPKIRPGQTHVLRMAIRGNRVSYYCDDLLVGTASTRVPRGTWVGLNMDPHGDPSCRFLDFTVRAYR